MEMKGFISMRKVIFALLLTLLPACDKCTDQSGSDVAGASE